MGNKNGNDIKVVVINCLTKEQAEKYVALNQNYWFEAY